MHVHVRYKRHVSLHIVIIVANI